MRYGNAHNVHKKNKDTDFTRQPEDVNEMLGNFQKGTNRGEHSPILEEGYSYQGGEDMIAVGEVGVSKRYGGGRDGMHHQMEKRTVYKKAPEPEEKDDKKEEPKDEGPKGPEKPEPPVSMSEKYVEARERANLYETDSLEGNTNPYGDRQKFDGSDDTEGGASSFLSKYKLNLENKYDQNDDGNYVDKQDNEDYQSALEKYEEEKAIFDAEQAKLKGTTGSI